MTTFPKAFALGAATALLAVGALQDKPPTAPTDEPTEQSLTKKQNAYFITLKSANGTELTQAEAGAYRDSFMRFGRSAWLVIAGHVDGKDHDTVIAYATDEADLTKKLSMWEAIASKKVIAEVKAMTVYGGGMRRYEQEVKPNTGRPPGAKPPAGTGSGPGG